MEAPAHIANLLESTPVLGSMYMDYVTTKESNWYHPTVFTKLAE